MFDEYCPSKHIIHLSENTSDIRFAKCHLAKTFGAIHVIITCNNRRSLSNY